MKPSDAMNIHDYINIIYSAIYFIILLVTIYYIKNSPIDAVQAGRRLNDEQSRYNAKHNLFLNLFSFRGLAGHPNFVYSLNQIDVLFHDNKEVVDAWHILYDSMQIDRDETEADRKKWEMLRIDLLDKMGQCFGYKNLKQLDIMKYYYSKGLGTLDNFDSMLKANANEFFLHAKVANRLVAEQILYNREQQDNKPQEPTQTS